MRWSIRYQLLLPLVLVLAGVMGISTWTAVDAANDARRQLEEDVLRVARTFSTKQSALRQKHILDMMKDFSGADYHLVDRTLQFPSEMATAYPSTLPRSSAPLELPPAQFGVEDLQKLRLGPPVTIGGTRYFCTGVRLSVNNPGPDAEPPTFYILYPESKLQAAQWRAIRPSLVLGIGVGLVAVAVAVGVSQRLGRRIRDLERRTRQIAAGDFSPMPLPRRNDELRDLSQSVNDMAQQLARLQETVRQTERVRLLGQLGGGLAHQLRNGVTGARLAVQLHAQECNGRTDPESLTVALRELDLVEANLKRFLDLGRVDGVRRERCDVGALLEEVVALLGPRCRHAQTELRWQRPAESVVLEGDAARLGHLFRNILANAVEAAGPGGWVEVRLRMEANRCVVEVLDSGPGPPAEIAERLFQPFVTGKREGIGLGLVVAQQAAQVHGGGIDWRRETDRTCFRVELPLV